MTKLVAVGTQVTATLWGELAHGVVEDYEHYSPNQVTFPVRFVNITRIMLLSEVTVLPEQPDDRQPPRHTGYYEHRDCSSCELANDRA